MGEMRLTMDQKDLLATAGDVISAALPMKCPGLIVVFRSVHSRQLNKPFFFAGPVDLGDVDDIERVKGSLKIAGWTEELTELRQFLVT